MLYTGVEMSSINGQAHMTAATELIEIMNIAAVVALASDFGWVLRDMSVSGVTTGMVIISTGLFIALSAAVYGGFKYHMRIVKKTTAKIVKAKLKICKLKAKRVSHNVLKEKKHGPVIDSTILGSSGNNLSVCGDVCDGSLM